jgi:hypothetical protein
MAHARFTQEQAKEMYDALRAAEVMLRTLLISTPCSVSTNDCGKFRNITSFGTLKEVQCALAYADAKPVEPITLLTQEQGGHYSALTCEDYDPDEPLEVIITPLGLIGLAERAGIPATWDDGDGATSITAR